MKTPSVVFEDALNHYSVCAKIAHSAVIPSHVREDALCLIFIAEKRKLPAADTKSHTGDFSAHSKVLSFSVASLLSLVRAK